MTTPDFTLHRERLLALRARLQGDMTQMEENARSQDHGQTTGTSSDTGDGDTDNTDQDLTLSLLGSGRAAFDQIREALERIADGSFGQCAECGRKIPEARLEAVPYAALCVRCASQQEQDHGL